MSLILRCANFALKKENYRPVLFLFAMLVMLGGVTGVIISMPQSQLHSTSFRLRLATINDGLLPAHTLISTRPIYVYTNDDLMSLEIDCVTEPSVKGTERVKTVFTLSNAARSGEIVLVSLAKPLTSVDCSESIGKALVNDQNRRLAEYIGVWKAAKDILEARLAQQDQRNIEVLHLSTDQVSKVSAREPVFEELYKVKWLLASAREALILTPPMVTKGYAKRRIFLFGLYGILSVCSGVALVFLMFLLTLEGQKRRLAAKTENE